MKNFDDGTEEIAALKGHVFAQQAFLSALIKTLQPERLPMLLAEYHAEIEAFRIALLNVNMPERVATTMEQTANDLTAKTRLRMLKMGVREG